MSSIVKVDTIQENTSANGITVDGLNIKDSKLVTANSVVTSNITDANVTLAKLAGDSVDATKIADNAISEEHLDVTSITGHTAETSIADGDTILIHDASASALRKMTKANFVSGIGGANTPAFQAYMNGNQTISNTTYTKLEMDAEVFDTDSKYDTGNYRFTPTVAGTYWVWGKFRYDQTNTNFSSIIAFYKNGSIISKDVEYHTNVTTKSLGITVTLDDNDYLEIFAYQSSSGTAPINGGSYPDQDTGTWGAYKLII